MFVRARHWSCLEADEFDLIYNLPPHFPKIIFKYHYPVSAYIFRVVFFLQTFRSKFCMLPISHLIHAPYLVLLRFTSFYLRHFIIPIIFREEQPRIVELLWRLCGQFDLGSCAFKLTPIYLQLKSNFTCFISSRFILWSRPHRHHHYSFYC